MSTICRSCGSTKSQTIADARTLGLLKEFQNGIHTCCQIVAWADEQWLAWAEAAAESGKSMDEISWPSQYANATDVFMSIRIQEFQDPCYEWPGSDLDPLL